MPDTLFTLDTLGDLDDGATRLVADQALREALADCDNRPALNKPRKVTLTIEMRPILNDGGGMKGVEAEANIKLSVPARKSRGEYLPTSVNGDTVEAYLPREYPTPLFKATTEEGN